MTCYKCANMCGDSRPSWYYPSMSSYRCCYGLSGFPDIGDRCPSFIYIGDYL